MKLLQVFKSICLMILLTVLTQTGGIIYILYKPFSISLYRNFSKKRKRLPIKLFAFALLYFSINFLITPTIARKSGRVTLPIFATNKTPLGPAKWYTVLMNRHYVTPEMEKVAIEVSRKMDKKYKGTTLNYLDANFPFIDGFPLIPHLSHDDGEKLDLAFFYKNKTGPLSGNPGIIGYGFCEGPKSGELNTVKRCLTAGHWQYDILSKLNIGFGTKKFQFDEARTKYMIQAFSENPKIRKLFLEPHLKNRFGLSADSKVRFQGCHSVRHDDHLHVQL